MSKYMLEFFEGIPWLQVLSFFGFGVCIIIFWVIMGQILESDLPTWVIYVLFCAGIVLFSYLFI